jgi:hypothetical protein
LLPTLKPVASDVVSTRGFFKAPVGLKEEEEEEEEMCSLSFPEVCLVIMLPPDWVLAAGFTHAEEVPTK